LKKELIKRYGILIRDASNFRGLTNNHFRVAAQSRNKNVELIKAIQEILQ
jgi:threonine-phosphate decarboxylase